MPEQCRKTFDAFFRNLIDGLVKVEYRHQQQHLPHQPDQGERQAAELQAGQEQPVWGAGHRLRLHGQPGGAWHLVSVGRADLSRYCEFNNPTNPHNFEGS